MATYNMPLSTRPGKTDFELIAMVEDAWKELNSQISPSHHVVIISERAFIDWGKVGRLHFIELMK